MKKSEEVEVRDTTPISSNNRLDATVTAIFAEMVATPDKASEEFLIDSFKGWNGWAVLEGAKHRTAEYAVRVLIPPATANKVTGAIWGMIAQADGDETWTASSGEEVTTPAWVPFPLRKRFGVNDVAAAQQWARDTRTSLLALETASVWGYEEATDAEAAEFAADAADWG